MQALVTALALRRHPEGGHFAEVFRSPARVRQDGRERSAVTTIYYLLRAGEISRWHVVGSDEVWHFYEGGGLDLFVCDPRGGDVRTIRLGPTAPGVAAVHVVPAGWWQAARPRGGYALAGCTVAPGFEFEDFRFVADLPGRTRPSPGRCGPSRTCASMRPAWTSPR
ncbi:MAG: cupin domain-containing protein [Vicinamibacterales bacterium]